MNASSLQNVKWFSGSGRCLEMLQKEIERHRSCLSIITSKDIIRLNSDREGSSVALSTSQLVIANGSLVNSPIDFKSILEKCMCLRSIVIGNNCLKKTSTLTINASPSLHTLRIGENSFTSNETESQGQLTIRSCPFLTNISIGKGSFRNAKTVHFSNLQQLVTIEIDATALQNCSEFSVVECELLSTLSFETKSFPRIAKLFIQSGTIF